MSQIIVIGAGQAGASLVAKLRNMGYTGKLTLIGAESHPPYQRPPLSKAYLLGEMQQDRLYLRPERFYQEHDITLRLGTHVDAIDTDTREVVIGSERLSYDQLALTTGSDARHLPKSIGGALEGVYVVRGMNDVEAMKPELQEGRHVLIVGGGYIGLEAAAVAAKNGLKVTLVEMGDRILQRVAAPETSDYFRALHTQHGVDIVEKTGLERLVGDQRVTGAVLSDGREIKVDFAIIGVGITPSMALAENAGLVIDNGIKTDAKGRSSDPAIWAAGDCASFPFQGQRIRLESVPNAIDQAEIVARNMLGEDVDYVAKPWFWSDQYAVKLQIAGLNTGYDTVITRRADPNGPSASFWYYQGDKLLAVDAMNDPRAYMIGKRLIEAGKSPEKSVISDANSDLKALLQ